MTVDILLISITLKILPNVCSDLPLSEARSSNLPFVLFSIVDNEVYSVQCNRFKCLLHHTPELCYLFIIIYVK